MTVKYEIFRGSWGTWDELFAAAAEFANKVGELRLINISHSCTGNDGVVTVWYWDGEQDDSALEPE